MFDDNFIIRIPFLLSSSIHDLRQELPHNQFNLYFISCYCYQSYIFTVIIINLYCRGHKLKVETFIPNKLCSFVQCILFIFLIWQIMHTTCWLKFLHNDRQWYGDLKGLTYVVVDAITYGITRYFYSLVQSFLKNLNSFYSSIAWFKLLQLRGKWALLDGYDTVLAVNL